MRSNAIAQTYIDRLKVEQAEEQIEASRYRIRGITITQSMSPLFPIFMNTLEINQVTQIFTPLERDNIIDYLIQ
jgi:DUF4097 and DUF4098 domain-containing protein YvlB